MNGELWTCTNKQDGQVKLLWEATALDLDNRLWNKKIWAPGDDVPRAESKVEPITERFDVLVQSVKCWHCEAYHVGNPHECRRPVHEKFV